MFYICLSVSGISAHIMTCSGNRFCRPQDPFKHEPHEFHDQLKELSLNNVGFLQQKATEKNGNLSWEFVSNLSFSEGRGYYSSTLIEDLRSDTSPPHFLH